MNMNLSRLHPVPGAKKKRKRRGRGPGCGLGKTSGRGTKGQKSISGYSRKRGFEGGQMPLHRRLPKRGFTNIFRKEYREINLNQLERIDKEDITLKDLAAAGLIKKESVEVKILGRGKISSAKIVHAHRFSKSAQNAIEKAGGKAILIGRA